MIVVITPYRDRPRQKEKFISHMRTFLEQKGKPYLIVIAEQSDDGRPFNRGAMKNIGYLEVKKFLKAIIPDDSQVVYVNQDIDVLPLSQECIYAIPNIDTIYNPYGVQQCLAKIHMQSSKVMDASNGYPNNYWAWGLEDVCMQARADSHGFQTDRTNFEWMGTNNLWTEQGDEGPSRMWAPGDVEQNKTLYLQESANREVCWENGLNTIRYNILEVSANNNVIHLLAHIL